ncbi:amidohydrolase family protein [Nocardioides sp. TRM66260-LWL]|uniref:amidohydrolase n=1 Tax=Nocardioides sp. TRM66260-LWL TaxID=2874478 RepID=UPI001CC749F5|nr:amidohydrolase family protein [Nocardioides sp. TRM66260-LWL]MBZ5735704.1 amidohydrolase family protein [Nocardioides sp. TRM66260-LWL]
MHEPDLLIREVRPVALDQEPATGIGGAGPVDVLLAGGRVAAVAPTGALDPTLVAGAETLAGEGRWLLPGLWDQHVHLGQWSLTSARLDLADVRSAEQAVRRVADRLAELPGLPVVGWGHRSAGWPRRPTVAELDRVSGDVPVVLISGDAHHAWLNTAALLHLALPVRDDVVREAEWFAAYGRLASLVGDDGTSPAAYRRALEAAAAQGVVGLVDFEFSGGAAEWRQRWAEGCDLLRVRMAVYADGLDAVLAEGLRTGDPLVPGDDRLTMGSLKIISDGSLNTRTAWCCAPYAEPDLVHPAGLPNLDAAELHRLLATAHAHGLTVATHAIGDAAAAAALDAYAATGAGGSIEHAQLVAEPDVQRLAALGLRASVQPAHLLDDRDLAERVWPDRTARCFPLRELLDAGADVVLGSDAPVAPLDPWLAMAAAVHRSGDERPAWHAEQALTPREALAASTDGVRSVRPGGPADVVLVDDDPLDPEAPGASGAPRTPDAAEAARRLRAASVSLTVAAGRVVHRR